MRRRRSAGRQDKGCISTPRPNCAPSWRPRLCCGYCWKWKAAWAVCRTERDGPRTIDLDLLLYDDVVRDDNELTLPHPRLHQRLFVLQPLAEIAPEWFIRC